MRNYKTFILIILMSVGTLIAQTQYAVLPVRSMGIDRVTTQTVDMLLRQEIVKETRAELISQNRTAEVSGEELCMDLDCAVAIGSELEADKVVTATMSKLGSKIVVQFMLFDVGKNRTILADNVIAKNIDDLEMVIIRIAKSIARETPIDKSAEVGAIVRNEEKSLTRRRARRYTGFSFGYLFPQEGYRNKTDKRFTTDLRLGYELTNTAVGAFFGYREGFATNIYLSYLLTRTDICPYIGGALGFHWVYHENDKRSDGFELTASTGLRLFRTYNFQVMVNLDYIYTLNDFDDQALVLTIGLLK